MLWTIKMALILVLVPKASPLLISGLLNAIVISSLWPRGGGLIPKVPGGPSFSKWPPGRVRVPYPYLPLPDDTV